MLEINCPNCLSSNILEDRQVERDIVCISCGATFLVEKLIPEEQATSDEQTIENEQTADQTDEVLINPEDLKNIVISTGPPTFEYEIIDTIIVLDTLDKNFFHETEPSLAFEGVKKKLRTRGLEKGAHAIINCHFDYRVSAGHGIFGIIHDLEIFAYGTLVKRI